MQNVDTNSVAWSEPVRALPFGQKTSPELLSAAARSGALGLLAAAEDQNKGGVREVRLGKGKRMGSVPRAGDGSPRRR